MSAVPEAVFDPKLMPFRSPKRASRILVGLSGVAGAGKGEAAKVLVQEHGFIEFSFSDPLYRQVSEAFSIPLSELYDRELKEKPHPLLKLRECKNREFVSKMSHLLFYTKGVLYGSLPLSPREVLQLWGTEFRRSQDPNYWLSLAKEWFESQEPGARCVNTSVRFLNEKKWVESHPLGAAVMVKRPGFEPINAHVSEDMLLHEKFKYTLVNNGTKEQLREAVNKFFSVAFPSEF